VPTTLGFGYSGNGCDAPDVCDPAWQCNATLCAADGMAWTHPAAPKPGCSCDATFDQFCADNAWAFYEWGMAEERVAAVLPFFWYTEAGSVGLETLPLCRTAWKSIGRKILQQPNRSAPVRGVGSSPGAAAQCPGVAAGTPPPGKALIRPGHRNWCANTNP